MEEKIELNDQIKLKGLCRGLSIIFFILRIVLYIAIPFIILSLFIAPKFIKNVKYEDNVIRTTYSGDKLEVVKKDDKVKIYINGKNEATSSSVETFDLLSKEISKHTPSELIGITESILLISIAVIFITSELFRHYEKLFKNIRNERTPFTDKNLSLLKTIINFNIILILIPILSSVVFNLILKHKSGCTLDFNAIIILLVLLVVTYIFKYAIILQNKTEYSIYDEDKK